MSKRKLILEPHDPKWIEFFKKEATIIRRILGSHLLAIHHIGSTAIPSIIAKPIVDILSIVSSLDAVDQLKEDFKKADYVWKGEYGIPGRRYLFRLAEDRVHHRVHVHIYQRGHFEIARHLAFVSYLQNNTEAAKEYEKVKLELRDKFFNDRERYQEEKSEVIESLLKKAMGQYYIPSGCTLKP
ncbi:MAG: GrpB family protein [Promethearchaeota archaeon]